MSSRSGRFSTNVSLHVTVQTDVLVETLQVLSAKVRWRTLTFVSSQDHAAADIAVAGTSTDYDWNRGTLLEYWWCGEQRHTFPGAGGGQSFKGLNMHGSFFMTFPSPSLACLSRHIRSWLSGVLSASCDILSSQGRAVVVSAKLGTAKVFAWKGQLLLECWWHMTLSIPGVDGYDQLHDDGGDASQIVKQVESLGGSCVWPLWLTPVKN